MAPALFGMTLPLLLSLNAGFVDTAGFLALQGCPPCMSPETS